MKARLVVAALLAGGALVAAPQVADAAPRVHTVTRVTCDAYGSCVTRERRCLRFSGERFCTRWHVTGRFVR